MKTFTVPVFLGVRADDKQEAVMKVLELIEDCFYDVDPEEFPYVDLGREDEVIEQEELK